jgi:hypothetical protein
MVKDEMFPECEVWLPGGEEEGSTAGQRVGDTLTRAETIANISNFYSSSKLLVKILKYLDF